jgi:hydrogenase maturation protease
MTQQIGTLVVGIGSPHADDQAGWLLIERLTATPSIEVPLRKATVPHELLDWMEACADLHIIDACDTGDTVYRLDCSQDDALPTIQKRLRSQSSHQFGIDGVIRLGKTLGRFPDRVVVWGIPGENFGPGQSVSASCQQHIDHCAVMLTEELVDA